MKFSEFITDLNLPISTSEDFEVAKICSDHRKLSANSIYVAIKGMTHDGHDLIQEAEANGAKVIFAERPVEVNGAQVFVVQSTRKILSQLSHSFYGKPSGKLKVVGITGTNGKTSVSLMLEAILKANNIKAGVIGTIDHHCCDQTWATSLTTVDPLVLHERLADFVKLKATVAIMEVSSHALSQCRADHVLFDLAVFTNLSRDHLDYHKNLEDYFAAKARLFHELLSNKKQLGLGIINADDAYANKLCQSIKAVTYGKSAADFRWQIIQSSFLSTQFQLNYKGKVYASSIPLIGEHNVANAISAVATAIHLGISVEESLKALQPFADIPGRLQRVSNSSGVHVFVDYAHTDDALRSALQSLKKIRDQQDNYKAQIHLVFGCGGDRDKGKRPMMAKVAETFADKIIVTSDNPRTEDPSQIIEDVMLGFAQNNKVEKVVNRREAIVNALKNARKDDVVLIAGKGHEDYQIIGTERTKFSDYEEAKKVLDKL